MAWGWWSSNQKCPCKTMLVALGKARGFRGKMGCGPVAFPVFLWWCLRHLSPRCFCACPRHLEFPVPAGMSRILCWVRCSLLVATPAAAILQLSVTGRFPSAAAECVQLGTSFTGAQPHKLRSWGTLVLPHTLLPLDAAPWQGQESLALSSHWLLCSNSTLCVPCVQVLGGLCLFQFSSWGQKRYWNEFMGSPAWSLSTVPPAEIKHCSPRYLSSNLLFQSRRENYRPLITQGEERTTPIFVISSTTIKHFRKRAWKPEIAGQGSFRLVPSLIAHRRNKNEGLSLLLSLASKNICPIWDQELGLLGAKMLSLGKVPLLFPGCQFRAFIDFKAGWSGCISWVWPGKYHERVSPVIPTLSVVLTLELWKAQSPPHTPILEASSFDKDFEIYNQQC